LQRKVVAIISGQNADNMNGQIFVLLPKVSLPNMSFKFHCHCGSLNGEMAEPQKAIRGICYCRDCQTYAHFLGKPRTILDSSGGTDVIATLAKYVSFKGSTKSLACLSLTENARLLRWYATCCNTPIANTLRNHRMPYVGLIHSCLGVNAAELDKAFSQVQLHLNVESATTPPNAVPIGKLAALSKYVPALILSRVSGSYRHSPFFEGNDRRPVAMPRILTSHELENARKDTHRTSS
jgi:hypothetical protein